MTRKKIIAGNWKMNRNHEEAAELARGVVKASGGVSDVDVVLCPPFTSLQAVAKEIGNSSVMLGAQNMHWEESGAYTGEISANMLLTLGCRFVILGHSERRSYFGETDATVAKKTRAALDAGLTPIVCVGETKQEREEGVTERVVETQIRGAFEGLDAGSFTGTVIAYEPVWAIGTGLTATAQQAQDVHKLIRELVADIFDDATAEKTRIQYGGSMKPANAEELLSQPDIDGGLIGGAALDPDSFAGIVNPARP